jgi:hypothetical protein
MADNELGILQDYGLAILYFSLISYGLFISYLQQTYGYPCE